MYFTCTALTALQPTSLLINISRRKIAQYTTYPMKCCIYPLINAKKSQSSGHFPYPTLYTHTAGSPASYGMSPLIIALTPRFYMKGQSMNERLTSKSKDIV